MQFRLYFLLFLISFKTFIAAKDGTERMVTATSPFVDPVEIAYFASLKSPTLRIVNKLNKDVTVYVKYFTKSTRNISGVETHYTIAPSGHGDMPADSPGPEWQSVTIGNDSVQHLFSASSQDDPLIAIVEVRFLYRVLPAVGSYVDKTKRIVFKRTAPAKLPSFIQKFELDKFGLHGQGERVIHVGWNKDKDDFDFKFEGLASGESCSVE